MNEIEIKNELISFYNSIKQELSLTSEIDDFRENFSAIFLIKELKKILLNNNICFNSELLKDYYLLENQMRKLEYDNKYYIGKIMTLKLVITSLEIKINAYMKIAEEYDELKTKIKFAEGKFLDNDRKDNEIFILRAENSSLKKDIAYLENQNQKYKRKKIEYKEKIKNMENIIQNLNKTINSLKMKNCANKTRNIFVNLFNNKTIQNSSSKIHLKTKSWYNNVFKNLEDKNYITSKNIRNNKNKNFDDYKYISNLFPEKLLFEKHKNKSTISMNNKKFDLTFSNIFNKFNNKKIKIPIKKEFFDLIKKKRKNSISKNLNHNNNGNKIISYKFIKRI